MKMSASGRALLVTLLAMTFSMTSCELLQNGGFEGNVDHWHCWNFRCEVLDHAASHQGSHAIRTHNRQHDYQGPSQEIKTVPGKDYHAESWVKILTDKPGKLGQKLELEVNFEFPDGSHDYVNVAMRPLVTTKDGWIFMGGDFQAPPKTVHSTTFYYQGPDPGVDFAVDQASVTEITSDPHWQRHTDDVINRIRKSNIHVHVTTSGNIDKSAVKIQVLQKRKSFPFGTEVNSWKYVDAAQQKYRDFIHAHFNWAVPGNALKWRQLDWNQGSGSRLYDRALNTINGLRKAGLKVRGHNMVWSVEPFIPEKVKAQSGNTLRQTVKQHIQWTMDATSGLLEHWDVNNENLHGQWFQERLHDRDYDLELFRMMYAADPKPKLFLNDYNVVAQGGWYIGKAYLAQAQRYKKANVHVYGLGVQCHFHKDQEPNPTLIKTHLDTLAQAGLPIWVTELDVQSDDENKRADYIERALRALYGHPAVEGIMFWGFWGTIMSAKEAGALVTGNDLHLTAAGRRVLDLLENQWMTDETRTLSDSGNSFTVRGFHGDYEIRIMYHGQELKNLRSNFTLGKGDETVNEKAYSN